MDDTAPLRTDATRETLRELRELVRLSWPITVAQLGTIAMSLVDTAILGRVSIEDLAGASIGRAIGFASVTLTMGVATGLEPLASQALGAGDPGRAWMGLLANMRACTMLWLPSVLVSFAVTLALAPLGVEATVIERSRAYLLGQAPMMGFIGIFLANKVFLQAHGITRPALWGSGVANVVNFVVCNVLVRGDAALVQVHLPPLGLPHLGAFGGGLALSISTLVLALFVYMPARARKPKTLAPPIPAGLVWKLGMPVGMHMLAEYAVFTLIALLAGRLGARVVSAHQIAIALASFMYMGALGVSGATAVRVGLAVGAGRAPRRAGLLGIGVGAAFMSIGVVLFSVFPTFLVDIFTDDPDTIVLGAQLLRIAALFQLFDGVQVVASGALRGAGDVRFPFVLNVAAYWLLCLPVALFLGFGMDLGARGLWWGITLGLVFAAVALTSRFMSITRTRIARV
jgi:MATE family multidrug resistance protein